jgi:hypothetical protein
MEPHWVLSPEAREQSPAPLSDRQAADVCGPKATLDLSGFVERYQSHRGAVGIRLWSL